MPCGPDARIPNAGKGREGGKRVAHIAVQTGKRGAGTWRPWRLSSLSAKFLFLTVIFVMIVEVLILVPSVANYRWVWMMGRLDQARAASGIFDSALGGDPALQRALLMTLHAESVVIRADDMSEMIKATGPLPPVDLVVREGEFSPWRSIRGAFDQVVNGGGRIINVVGEPMMGRQLEVMFRDDALQAGMLVYMRNIILISLLIAFMTALLVFAAARTLLIRPIQRMSDAMLAFAAAPADATRIIRPERREDELGVAQRQLAAMQGQVHATLRQQRRLADLGLAVSKINHDMRNILAAASLVSDRLSDVDDPVVQRVAPRLIRALDRAVTYSEGVLEYGRANEAPPNREPIAFEDLAKDVRDLALPSAEDEVPFEIDVPPAFRINVDREQMLRVLLNLSRNAVQAIRGSGEGGAITLRAKADGEMAVIELRDTGPGLPSEKAATLFAPFGATTTKGGSGLGLAIARELVEAHGGAIVAMPNAERGTRMVIELPGAVL